MALVSMTLSDLLARFQGHDIIQRQIYSKMIQDGAIVTIADQQKVVHGLSNRATLNDLERLQTHISRSGHFLMPNICETAKDTAIVFMESE